MTEDEPTPMRRRFGPVRLAALAVGLVVLAALLGVWFQRKPIAAGYIDRHFAAAHVPIRYRIADLNLGRQRLRDVVIGDPAHPDLIADWLETDTRIGLDGARVLGVRGGRIRVRARLANGRLSLGSIDRLLPPPSKAPFALPALDLDVSDLRLRLDTLAGPVGIKLTGKGRLDGGFVGEAAAVAPRLDAAGCAIGGATVALHVAVHRAAPSLSGPVRVARLACGSVSATDLRADLDTALGAALDQWNGKARIAVGGAVAGANTLRQIAGTVTFVGSRVATGGTADLRSGGFVTPQVRGQRLTMAGRYRIGADIAFAGRMGGGRVSLASSFQSRLAGLGRATAGSPVAPIGLAVSNALAGAARGFDVAAKFAVMRTNDGGQLAVDRLLLKSPTGVRIAFAGGAGLRYAWPSKKFAADGVATSGGSGFPETRVSLSTGADGGVSGVATLAPYAVDGARVAAAPIRIAATSGGGARITTVVALSGPLGDGRIENVRLPINAVIGTDGTVAINSGCSDAAFDRLRLAGLDLRPTRLRLCPIGAALVRIAGGDVSGGARIAAPRLVGTLVSTPLTLTADNAELRLIDRGFVLANIAARLGAPDRVTRMDVGRLEGRVAGGAVGGRFAGADGQIGNVPLILSGATGDWRLTGGRLTLTGGLTVADAAAQPRFNPLASRDVSLTLAGGRIEAKGTLATPKEGVKVADVRIAHDLGRGTGSADLAVTGIAFDKSFQPDVLTRLTYGVIADVKGNVSGQGRIRWSPQGVTSTATLGTSGLDLAAAFGPVTGLKTELHFTDLLGMQTAPGQVATIASVNPGVAVENGTIRYRLQSPTEVQVEGGHWPFAGGDLTLDPTLLDFGEAKVRRMTFRVAGMDAAQFLQQFDFKNMDATGTFDGVLPMTFDADGGRIVNGHLTVREGGGSIAYVGDLTEKDLGFWGNVAFQALKSLKYRSLNIVMNGPLSGEMVTEVRFAGISQGEGTKSNFLIRRLTKLPFVFNVTIRAPFRGLIDTAQSFYDPKRLIERNLPALLQQQQKQQALPVQPPASEKMP